MSSNVVLPEVYDNASRYDMGLDQARAWVHTLVDQAFDREETHPDVQLGIDHDSIPRRMQLVLTWVDFELEDIDASQ